MAFCVNKIELKVLPKFLAVLLVLRLEIVAGAVFSCPAGMPVGAFTLSVQRAGQSNPLPLRTINRIEEGDHILYAPVLRVGEKRHGKVSVVLAPASASKRADEDFVVLDPKDADEPAEWMAPFRSSLAVYVYGPNGLSTSKVRGFLSKDSELISQLADYAEKTAQTEAVLQALTLNTETASENVTAALQGFASNSGVSNKLDRSAPAEQQTMALFRSLNPALSSYDPISPQGPQRLSQTTGLATTVAAMFLGSTVGLAAGGTAMALNLKTLLFPNEEFRSSYAQTTTNQTVALCGRREPSQGHTRLAYLWAQRIPDAVAPDLTAEAANNLPLGQKGALKVAAPDRQWKIVERAHGWTLRNDSSEVPVNVKAIGDQHALELDLAQAKVAPGVYTLNALWDWDKFAVKGQVVIRPLSTFDNAHLTAESQDRLVQHSGKQIVQLEGDDFQFVDRAALVRKGDKYNPPVNVPWSLPAGRQQGMQNRLELQIDTAALDAGEYSLLLMQQGGKTKPVDVKVVADRPVIENLPLAINAGETDQTVVLRGRHLDRITAVTVGDATLRLNPSRAAGRERSMRLHLASAPEQGATMDLNVLVKDYASPLKFAGGVTVVPPRPKILDAKLSLPSDLEIALRPGELPAGLFVSANLRVKRLTPSSVIALNCRNRTGDDVTSPVGSERNGIKVQSLGSDSVFVSFDPGNWPAGCVLTASMDNGSDGRSEPFQVGRVIRLPRIETFKLTDEPAGEGSYIGVITGQELEQIDRSGWDATHVAPAQGLPTPISGEGQKQSLRLKLPWPSPAPHSPLYVCFRGESECRATTRKW